MGGWGRRCRRSRSSSRPFPPPPPGGILPVPPGGAASALAPQMLRVLFLLLLLACPGSSAAGPAITARTLSPCYSADLRPAQGGLVSAPGCTVLLVPPPLQTAQVVLWEYRSGPEEGTILTHAVDGPTNTSRPYQNRTLFNQTDFSLRLLLGRGDGRLYRFRTEAEATGWFQLRVVEPLSQPEILGNSSVKAGGSTQLVCNAVEGQADSYWWKKNGEVLLGSEHIQFVGNSTLSIAGASINDSGHYACVVSNQVSQNETSFLLHVQNAANVVLPMILACVALGSLAGVLVWCRRRDRPCHNPCR